MDSTDNNLLAASLAQQIGAGADSAQISAAVVAAWRDIDAVLHPIIGKQGVAALYMRGVHVCVADHPWLRAKHSIPVAMDFDAMAALFAQQSSSEGAAAGGAVFKAFFELLTSMVGRSLTEQLLRSMWKNNLNDPDAQDASS